MQLSNIFLSLVLATAVVAKGGRGNSTTKAATDKSLCKEMATLNKLVKLASNETKLEDKAKNNATEIADIKSKATKAQTKLATMKANSTLTSTCAVISAAQKTEDDCDEMEKITKFIALTANTTKLIEKTKGNTTKEGDIKAEAVKAQTKLDALMANTTLMSVCSDITAAKTGKKANKKNGPKAAGAASAAASSASTTRTIRKAVIDLNAHAGFIPTIAAAPRIHGRSSNSPGCSQRRR